MRNTSLLVLCVLIASVITTIQADYGSVAFATYLGGSGADDARAVVFANDGDIVVGGYIPTRDGGVASTATNKLADGNGFLIKISTSDWSVKKFVGFCEVKPKGLVVNPSDGSYFVACSDRLIRVDKDLNSVIATARNVSCFGPIDYINDNGRVDVIVIHPTNRVSRYNGTDLIRVWSTPTGKDNLATVAVDKQTNYIYAGGYQNTKTGYEAYKSPYIYRYNSADGSRDTTWKMYDWSGPEVSDCGGTCTDRMLQADTDVQQLRYDTTSGRMWLGIGTDGGNTVITKSTSSLTTAQAALIGSCYSSACYGYKSAKSPGAFARIKSDYSDLDVASFVVPYLGLRSCSTCNTTLQRNYPVCKCHSTSGGPNSMVVDGAFDFTLNGEDLVLAYGPSYFRAPETLNAWYFNSAYAGGINWVGIFDKNLEGLKMSTLIQGTNFANHAALSSSLLFVTVGTTQVPSAPSNTNVDALGNQYLSSLPVTNAVQSTFGGGSGDAYIYVHCLNPSGQCGSVVAPPYNPNNNPGQTSPNNGPGGNNNAPGSKSQTSSGLTLVATIGTYMYFLYSLVL